MLCEQWMPLKARNMQKGTPRSLLHGFQIGFSFFQKQLERCLHHVSWWLTGFVRDWSAVFLTYNVHFFRVLISFGWSSLQTSVLCIQWSTSAIGSFLKNRQPSHSKAFRSLPPTSLAPQTLTSTAKTPSFAVSICTGTAWESPKGPPFCTGCFGFFLGTSACRSHEKPPNQTKHLEDATKWPQKLDRKILDWPGSSKATQAIPRLVGGSCCFQPWDGLCSFAATRPVQDLSVYLVWPLGRIFQVFGPVAKWWPLGLSEAVPVQNGGPWGCVTRLVGGSCHAPKGHHFVQAMPWRAPGATILYRLLWFFLGTSACRSHGKPPNRTKRLEGATKWLDKVERKILDWPGSSKGKSHLPALSHTPNCHHFVQALPQRARGHNFVQAALVSFGYLCLQAKHLEDATTWPHKVDRKILDWPGSSKATQAIPRLEAAKATYQPCHTPPRGGHHFVQALPGRAPGATILYRLLSWILGTSAWRSHEKPPNQTKYLEDATKWPHKVDRKILDWPGSSKATQAISARATYQPCHTPPRATILYRHCLGESPAPSFCTGTGVKSTMGHYFVKVAWASSMKNLRWHLHLCC